MAEANPVRAAIALKKQGDDDRAAGRIFEAIAAYEQATRLHPELAAAHAALGNLYEQQGWQELAIERYRHALALEPASFTPESHLTLGNLLRERGKIDEAIAGYRQAIKLHPGFQPAYRTLGKVLVAQGDLEAAAQLYDAAVETELDVVGGKEYSDLGIAWEQRGQLDKAIAAFHTAIEVQPDFADAHCNLGNALKQQGNAREALLAFQEALAIDPNFVEAYYNLGTVLADLDKVEAAIAAFAAAIALRPDFAEAQYNLATALVKCNRLPAAIAAYEAAIRIRPDYAYAHWNLGHALLLSGDLPRGFVEYDWHWRSRSSGMAAPRAYSQPLWQGEDLAGKRLLLYDHQGFGDTLHLIRYAALVADKGASVLVETKPALARLLRSHAQIQQVISEGEPLPEFDVHVPMLSLPRLLGTTMATIPDEVPYFDASCFQLPASSSQLAGDRYNIGIAWASGYRENASLQKLYREKSCPPLLFQALLGFDRVMLYSLQVGRDAVANLPQATREHLQVGKRLQDLSPFLHDFADTAAAIATLDLVITVDTAIAHLAGAMGKSVWVLLPFAPDWRWFLDRADSPWYPTMRLFRQPQPGDWQQPFQQLLKALGCHQLALKSCTRRLLLGFTVRRAPDTAT